MWLAIFAFAPAPELELPPVHASELEMFAYPISCFVGSQRNPAAEFQALANTIKQRPEYHFARNRHDWAVYAEEVYRCGLAWHWLQVVASTPNASESEVVRALGEIRRAIGPDLYYGGWMPPWIN